MRLDILKPFIISIVALSWSISLCGQGLERAKELYKAGKFAEAKPIFEENIRNNGMEFVFLKLEIIKRPRSILNMQHPVIYWNHFVI